jgi:hypothetical protein
MRRHLLVEPGSEGEEIMLRAESAFSNIDCNESQTTKGPRLAALECLMGEPRVKSLRVEASAALGAGREEKGQKR